MKKLPKVKAVIFDMDGVIVDSMPYHFLAWYEALRPYGARISCFDVYIKEGENWLKSLKDFLKKAGVTPKKKLLFEIFALRQRIFKKYFKRFIFEGAEDILFSLKSKGYLLSLVTGTPDHEVKRILPKKIYHIFDTIISGNSVKKGKPYPDPYLKAAEMLKVSPADCVVIENAPYGIESAKRAGMHCLAISTSLPKEFLKKADVVVDDLSKIFKLLIPLP